MKSNPLHDPNSIPAIFLLPTDRAYLCGRDYSNGLSKERHLTHAFPAAIVFTKLGWMQPCLELPLDSLANTMIETANFRLPLIVKNQNVIFWLLFMLPGAKALLVEHDSRWVGVQPQQIHLAYSGGICNQDDTPTTN